MSNWKAYIVPDEFDKANGITISEIIENIEAKHACGDCDSYTCPICQDKESNP